MKAKETYEFDEQGFGPLGPGHAPAKDPMKGVRGVQAAALSMESISFFLVLTVILRVDNGAHWTTANWVTVTVIAAAMMILAFLQRFRFGLPAALGIQVVALVAGVFVHISMVIVAVLFIIVWWYIMHLRSSLIERMKHGLLTTQHS